ncbi:hypothetical protein FB45DRAFT_1011155 [Roridomyces roridus]|uniref:F-box domain-containing protein n=1 Tax=Roridomyces roridus TaxID=1738132 RepID=A0AAD7B2I0_9AGAR|nr:hypothetical protein FB45DRAFT_1011155 [Roridomyces roridus]
MSSVLQLRQRIDSLSEDIIRRQDVLRDLENKRSAARSELNSILDPMSRMPLEISSEILLQSISETPTLEELSVFTRVSHSWRAAALGTTSMWNTIRDEGIPPARFPQAMSLWLQRGKALPLSLSIRRHTTDTFPPNFAVLKEHALRVEKLELHGGSEFERFRLDNYPFLGLKSLTIDAPYTRPPSESFSLHWIFEMLRSPQLVECNILIQSYYTDDSLWMSRQAITRSPGLRRLRLGRFNSSRVDPDPVQGLLWQLSAPALEWLSVSLHFCELESTARSLGECFDLIPRLTSLDIAVNLNVTSFLASLAAFPNRLPALRHLVVHDWSFQGVVEFLATLRKSLRSLRLVIPKARVDEELTRDLLENKGILNRRLTVAKLHHDFCAVWIHMNLIHRPPSAPVRYFCGPTLFFGRLLHEWLPILVACSIGLELWKYLELGRQLTTAAHESLSTGCDLYSPWDTENAFLIGTPLKHQILLADAMRPLQIAMHCDEIHGRFVRVTKFASVELQKGVTGRLVDSTFESACGAVGLQFFVRVRLRYSGRSMPRLI